MNPIEIDVRRVREKLGGSHTVVTYPPLHALSPESDVEEIENAIRPTAGLNVYLHIAFCEHICGFCHYAKTYSAIGEDNDFVLHYLKALAMELTLRSETLSQSQISTVFIGGGTPTSLSVRSISSLLEHLSITMPDRPATFCAETSPETIAHPQSQAKLDVFAEHGVNRYSVGVQTFDDELLKRYRGHDVECVRKSLNKLKIQDAVLNVDLIQDLPGQTVNSILDDIAMIDSFRPDQVTWYIMRIQKGSSWYKIYARGDLTGIPTFDQSVERRRLIIERMADIGYYPVSGCRFVRRKTSTDVFKEARNDASKTLLGFGVSAYSHGWGWMFRNTDNQRYKSGIRDYVSRLMTNRSPIQSSFRITPDENRAGQRVNGIRTVLSRFLTAGKHRDEKRAAVIVQHLMMSKLLTVNDEGDFELTLEGRLYEEEIASLFYSSNVQTILQERESYWAS